ncbi:sodium- and chloride-dependent creatine transporter 1 [Babesia caballi]|uniref:Sodium- and chloride-dependent creatine transporter 1 n=1 Tax=Babesia caballi TaxID=5871 RepID=A0AAV4LY67_BABCB|nr:sodium- and chloride-dependent creatine transporter 1 [Babesia caballi]
MAIRKALPRPTVSSNCELKVEVRNEVINHGHGAQKYAGGLVSISGTSIPTTIPRSLITVGGSVATDTPDSLSLKLVRATITNEMLKCLGHAVEKTFDVERTKSVSRGGEAIKRFNGVL